MKLTAEERESLRAMAVRALDMEMDFVTLPPHKFLDLLDDLTEALVQLQDARARKASRPC